MSKPIGGFSDHVEKFKYQTSIREEKDSLESVGSLMEVENPCVLSLGELVEITEEKSKVDLRSQRRLIQKVNQMNVDPINESSNEADLESDNFSSDQNKRENPLSNSFFYSSQGSSSDLYRLSKLSKSLDSFGGDSSSIMVNNVEDHPPSNESNNSSKKSVLSIMVFSEKKATSITDQKKKSSKSINAPSIDALGLPFSQKVINLCHYQGESCEVMDSAASGDFLSSRYDPSSAAITHSKEE